MTILPDSVSELSIVFTDDSSIQELNKNYRNKDKATDVLSFSQIEGEGPAMSLGDIVISLDTANKQAKEHSLSLAEEVLRLLIHGILHLLGYDHENVPKEEAEKMFKLQDELFDKYSINLNPESLLSCA